MLRIVNILQRLTAVLLVKTATRFVVVTAEDNTVKRSLMNVRGNANKQYKSAM